MITYMTQKGVVFFCCQIELFLLIIMTSVKRIIILAFIYTLCVPCHSQSLISNVKFFNYNDGLTDRNVYSINQDDRGLIWIGTGNGLCRFDGRKFQAFNEKNSPLGSGRLIKIVKDKFGNFWIQKINTPVIHFNPLNETELSLEAEMKEYGELTLFDTRNSSVAEVFFKNEEDAIFILNDSNKIVPFGNLVISKDNIVHSTSWRTLMVSNLSHQQYVEISEQGDTLRDFSNLERGTLFCEDDKMIFRKFLEGPSDSFDSPIFTIGKNTLPESMPFKKDGNPYLFKLIPSDDFYSIHDQEENIWVSFNNKILLFDSNRNFQLDLTGKLVDEFGKIGGVNEMFVDKHNRLWIGSGYGLSIIELKENPFQRYINKLGVSTRWITELSNNRLLISTYGGIKILDKNSGKLLKTFDKYGMTLTEYKSGLYLFASGVSIMMYNDSTESIKTTNYRMPNYRPGMMDVLYYDSEEEALYVGSDLGKFDNKDSVVLSSYEKLNEFQDFNRRKVSFFYKNHEGLWIATLNGLYLLDKEIGIIDHVLFPHNHIKHFHEDQQGDFWLATGGGGLIHWDRKSDTKRQITTEDGLSHNVLYAVYEDQSGYLWLPSNKGLMRFDKRTGEVNVFQQEDGICHEEFNTHSHYQGEDGRLYFGGLAGVTAFSPEEVKLIKNDAPFIVTQYQQFDAEDGALLNRTEDLRSSKNITLKPRDKFFILDFALLDYSQNDIVYAWKIDGLDEEWNFQKENSVRINGLDYGNYTLQLKARGSGGQWAENKLSISIKVLKPFYLNPVFLAFVIIGILALLYAYFKYRLRKVERSKEKLKSLVDERTSELSEKNQELETTNEIKDKLFAIIAHDLRGPAFSLQDVGRKLNYLIKTEQMDRLQAYGASVDVSVDRLNFILNNLLNWANQNLKTISLQPEKVNLLELTHETLVEFEEQIKQKLIKLHLDIPTNLLAFSDKEVLRTITRNLISNAIKFTQPKGNIKLHAKKHNGSVKLAFRDDGVGIPMSKKETIFELRNNKSTPGTDGEKGTGLGLNISRKLAQLNGGDIVLDTTPNQKGTTFVLEIPSSFS